MCELAEGGRIRRLLRALGDELEPKLDRFPAVDPRATRRRVEAAVSR
jgi:hypothetical protein